MKYFTFIGLGTTSKGYEDVEYKFTDDLDHKFTTKFVQIPVVERYKKEIDQIYAFVTEEAKNNYLELVEKLKDTHIQIESIPIKKDIEFNDFVDEMLKRLKPKDKIMIGVTFMFRAIPMKLLFTLKYIEPSRNIRIEHIYYGKKITRPGQLDEGYIEDIISDYELQKAGDLLTQFDRTLIITEKEVREYVKSDDLQEFLCALAQFNDMTEYCEFDQSTDIVDNILLCCDNISSEEDKYKLVIPIVEKIKEKFANYRSKKYNKEKRIELIRILLEHERYQIAITFTDQFFRDELIHATLEPNNPEFKFDDYLENNHGIKKSNNMDYSFSSFLISNVYKLRGINTDNFYDLTARKKKNISRNTLILNQYKGSIRYFYNKIRNNINHGVSIKNKDKIKNNINTILECISKL